MVNTYYDDPANFSERIRERIKNKNYKDKFKDDIYLIIFIDAMASLEEVTKAAQEIKLSESNNIDHCYLMMYWPQE